MYTGFLPSGGRKNDIPEYLRLLGSIACFEESGPPDVAGFWRGGRLGVISFFYEAARANGVIFDGDLIKR